MVKQPKVIKHKDNVTKEVVGTEAPRAVRAATPPSLDEQERVSQRIPEEGYKPRVNPKQDESDSKQSDEESSEESQSDDEEKGVIAKKDKDVQDPALSAPWLDYHYNSRPITSKDVPKSMETKVEEDPKDIKRKIEYPKELKKKSEDPEAIKHKIKETKEYPKDTTNDTSSERRLDPQDLFKLQQQILEKIKLVESLVNIDNHALTLAMLTQLASITGAINHVLTSVDKVVSNLKIINDHGISQEEATIRGIAKIEELVNNAWRSQGRNRASIDENNRLLKELVKSLETKESSSKMKNPKHT